MSDEVSKATADIINAARQAGQDAMTFIQQQAPDVAKQLVMREQISAMVRAIGLAILIVSILIGWAFFWKWSRSENKFGELEFWVPTFFGSIIVIMVVSCFISKLTIWLQCVYAPKAVLFDIIFKK